MAEESQPDEDVKKLVESKLPVNRNYDFESLVPQSIPNYKQHNSELDRIVADLKHRTESGRLPRFRIGGPTGCGKTHLAQAIAQYLEAPMFTIQGKYSMDESDLLGHPMLVNGDTIWSDGPLTKAILTSQEREVVLLIDEVNRARPESKGVLFSALDDRCRIELDGRGGEVIEGKAENLIVIATQNSGRGYRVQDMDKAEKRRFGNKWDVDYLGVSHPEREISVLTERTPASEEVARTAVKIANEIRREARNSESIISMGVPTSNMISWMQTAYAYNEQGMDNVLVEAAKDSIIKPLYNDKQEQEDVLHTVKDHADGAPFTKKGFDEWKGASNSENIHTCGQCGDDFSTKRGLSTHKAHKHNCKMETCEICGGEYRGNLGLGKHYQQSHHKCDECGEVFGLGSELSEHEEEQH